MKLTILLASLLFAATNAKGVYVEGATTDSSVKLGANEAPRRGLGGQSDDRRMDQTAEAVVAAAKLGANEAPRRALAGGGKGGSHDDDDDDDDEQTNAQSCKASCKSGPRCTWCAGWCSRYCDYKFG